MRRRLVLDIGERAGWTFVQGATSTLLLQGFLGVAAWKAAVVGGVAALIAALKGLAATKVGAPSAATLPAALEATGAVVGSVTGTVVSGTGEVLGTVTGAVGGVLEDDSRGGV